jgi:hypothetical protein
MSRLVEVSAANASGLSEEVIEHGTYRDLSSSRRGLE